MIDRSPERLSEWIETTLEPPLDAQLDTCAFAGFGVDGEGTAKCLVRKSLTLVELIGIEPTTS